MTAERPPLSAALLAGLAEDRLARSLAGLAEADARAMLADWHFWARPAQLAPTGDWRVWLLMAGRGFGKTRAGAEWVRGIAEADPAARIALVGTTMGEARSVMVEGESGLLAIAPEGRRARFEPSLGRVRWPNGALATLYSAAEPEGLRGPQHSHAFGAGAEGIVPQRGVGADRHRRAARRDDARRYHPAVRSVSRAMLHRRRGATGAWSGQDQALAGWTGDGWRFVAPMPGMSVWSVADGLFARFDGSGWLAGDVPAARLLIGGEQVVGGRQPAIASPAGGAVIDSEARAAIAAILAALGTHGLIG